MRPLLPLLILTLSAPCQNAGASATLNLYTMEISGFAYFGADGKTADGPLIVAAQKIMARAGLKAEIALTPWARALLLAEQEKNTCVIGPRKLPTNATKFSWAGPIGRQRQTFYVRSDDPTEISHGSQLKDKSVAVPRGSFAVQNVAALGMKIDEGRDIATNFRKLAAGRVDFVLAGEIEASKYFGGKLKQSVKAVYFLSPDEHYLACNRDLAPATVHKLNAAVRAAAKAGELRELGISP